jgi:hypothetical protein
MQTWKESKALYRWLDKPDVTFAALMQPHFQQTREQATSSPVVLLVQATTDIDLSHRRKISGVGQIGNERGRGFFVQTVLAVRPQAREVLGCMAQEPFVRIPAPQGEQRHQRRKREERETDVWMRQVQAIGTDSAGKQVGACRRSGCRYVPVLPGESLDADALSGACSPESARAGKRGRAQLCADASKQGAVDRVGHPRLGRASSRGRGTAGMDLVDFGAHHARRGVGARGLVPVSLECGGLSPLPQKWLSH